MNWFFLALISTFLDTLVLFVDRFVVEKEKGEVGALPVVVSGVSFLVGIIYWTFSGFEILAFPFSAGVIAAGILILWANALYFLAVPQQRQSSIIIMVFQIHPIFVLVLSWIFLEETISPEQYIGFALILVSVLFLSFDRGKAGGRVKISSALPLLLLSTIIYAFASIILKWATLEYPVIQIAAFQGFGMALGGLSLFVLSSVRMSLKRMMDNNPARMIGLVSLNEGVSQAGKLLRLYAIAIGPVALVSAVGSTRVFLGVWVGAVLTALAPGIYREDIRGKSLLVKSLLSILTIAGLWFLQ